MLCQRRDQPGQQRTSGQGQGQDAGREQEVHGLGFGGGPENVNHLVGGWLRRHCIIHLGNLPYTLQHNAWAERGMAELKGAVFSSLEEAAGLLGLAWRRVDRETPRKVLSWRTREAAYEGMASCYASGSHAGFYRTVRSAVEQAVQGASTARARRRAERGAIYAMLEQEELSRRTRGGVLLEGVKGDGLT